jgi:hypothetical protein
MRRWFCRLHGLPWKPCRFCFHFTTLWKQTKVTVPNISWGGGRALGFTRFGFWSVCVIASHQISELPAPRRKSTNATTRRNRSYDQSAPHILSSLEIWHRRAFRIKLSNFLYGKARRSARHTRVARRQTNIDLKQMVLASFRIIYKSIASRADPKLQRYTIGFLFDFWIKTQYAGQTQFLHE